MKKCFFVILVLVSFNTLASTVKISSFNYGRSGQYYAELCGQVEGATSNPIFVRVMIDPRSKNPGTYNTVTGSDGKFCLAVISYRGEAEASVFGETEKAFIIMK
jgi:hypothetical protein